MTLTAIIRGQGKEVRTVNALGANLNTTRFPRPRDSSAPTDNGGVHGQWAPPGSSLFWQLYSRLSYDND